MIDFSVIKEGEYWLYKDMYSRFPEFPEMYLIVQIGKVDPKLLTVPIVIAQYAGSYPIKSGSVDKEHLLTRYERLGQLTEMEKALYHIAST